MINRRMFLIGAGSLISSAMANEIFSRVRDTGQMLLAAPVAADRRLYIYPDYNSDTQHFVISLGPAQLEPPRQIPTWRQFLASEGQAIQTEADLEALEWEMGLVRDQLDEPLPAQSWVNVWDVRLSPFAKAYNLLDELELGPELSDAPDRDPCLLFNEGAHPGDSSRWVEAVDARTIPALRSRLRNLDLPIEVVIDDA